MRNGKTLFKITLWVYLSLVYLPSYSFTISDIRIEGLQRVSAGIVFAAIPIKIGDDLTSTDMRDVVRQLFKTGSFHDVQIGRDGNILVIIVTERPAIDSIEIEGNKAIKTEALLAGLKKSGLAEGEIFKQVTLEHIRTDLERQYVSEGRYSSKIETELTGLPRNRVAIKINVYEGQVAGIKDINVIGNSVYDDKTLLNLLELKLPSLFSFFTKDDRYSKEKLTGDLENLESYYLDRGYLDFSIDSTQVAIAPNKEDVYITINVIEGKRYTVDKIEVAGELHDIPVEVVEQLIFVQPGQLFSRALMTASEEQIEQALGNSGYTFASATGQPVPSATDTTKVDVKFFIDAGKRAYVRRISFKGNTLTQDEVLRREMRQIEGGWASNTAIKHSKVRLERLGFFKEVNVETPSVAGIEDQIDVEFTVEEQPSASISATLGFAQDAGLILGANYQDNNVLGSGNGIGIGINHSNFQTAYNFSYLDPYYTVDGVSRGYSVFFRKSNFDARNIARFSTNTFGANVNFGYPIDEISRLNFSLGFENTEISEGVLPAQEISQFLAREGSKFDIFTLQAAYTTSALNRGLLPTGGYSQGLSFEITVPGGELEFYRLVYNGQIFFPLPGPFVLKLGTELGYGDTYGDTETYPFYKNFYSGGFGSVRGYKANTLGPRSTPSPASLLTDPDPIGGNVLVSFNTEVIFPLPFIEDQRQIKSAFFIDGGNVFNTDCLPISFICRGLNDGELRYTTGFAITWITGFAPLSFSVSIPLNNKPGDERESFQFELGRSF